MVSANHRNLYVSMVTLISDNHASSNSGQGPVSRKSREVFCPEKPFVKTRPAYSVKLVFSYVVKGIKIKIIAKFGASRRLRFEDTKRIMSPEMFRDFRETGPRARERTGRREKNVKRAGGWRTNLRDVEWLLASLKITIDTKL